MDKKRIKLKQDPAYILNLDDLFLRNKYQDKINKGPTDFQDLTLTQEMDLIYATVKLGVRGTIFLPGPEPFERAVKDGIALKQALKEVISMDLEIGAHGYKHNDIDTAENYKRARKAADFVQNTVFSIKSYPYSLSIWRSPGCNWNKQIKKNIIKSGFLLHSDRYTFGPTFKIFSDGIDEIKWDRLICDLPFYFKNKSCLRWFRKNEITFFHTLLNKLKRIAKVPLMHVWCQRGYADGKIINKRFQTYKHILKDKINRRILMMPLGDLYLSWKYPVKIRLSKSVVLLDNSRNKKDSVVYLQFDHQNKFADRFYFLENGGQYSIGRFVVKQGEIKKIPLKEKKIISNLPKNTLLCVSKFSGGQYGVYADKNCSITLKVNGKKTVQIDNFQAKKKFKFAEKFKLKKDALYLVS